MKYLIATICFLASISFNSQAQDYSRTLVDSSARVMRSFSYEPVFGFSVNQRLHKNLLGYAGFGVRGIIFATIPRNEATAPFGFGFYFPVRATIAIRYMWNENRRRRLDKDLNYFAGDSFYLYSSYKIAPDAISLLDGSNYPSMLSSSHTLLGLIYEWRRNLGKKKNWQFGWTAGYTLNYDDIMNVQRDLRGGLGFGLGFAYNLKQIYTY